MSYQLSLPDSILLNNRGSNGVYGIDWIVGSSSFTVFLRRDDKPDLTRIHWANLCTVSASDYQRGPWEGDGGETGQRDGHQGSHVLSLAGGVTKDQLSLQSAFRVSFLKASVGNLSSYTASKNPRGSQGV
ncbi:hypothetical protein CISG_04235 [Coccidioides immitis RMSCC 3703]|uniref:Uncharacterized protein n=1 Tax=Coccidioides immitis RMSCC 3703 TaxID=454286 RepID=A0A0J8QTC4_COCIT|nr:hypothetical protein CISG_04235 [Coccidioides immitis RMSCC 3703]